MSAAQALEGVRVSVLLVGEHPCLFSPIVFLEKMGCECHFAASNEELRNLLGHTKLDIVLSLNTRHRLLEMMSLLAGLPINMFHLLPVEEGGWWLPVLREGDACLGVDAVRTREFSKVLTVMVRDIRVARSNAAQHSEAREYRDRDRPEIAFLKAAVALKVISGPERGGPFREARPT
jgi:hypothetical protein